MRGAGVKRGGGALFGGFAVCSGRSLTRIFNGNTIECALCCSVESFVTLTGGFCELFGNFCPISTTTSSSVVGFGLYPGALQTVEQGTPRLRVFRRMTGCGFT